MSWRWWFMSDPHLSRPERQALDEQAEPGRIRLSAMSLWEAQMLHRKGRLELPLPFGEWLRRAADPRLLTLAPLDVSVVTALDDLPGSFHRDPADRVIVATARVHVWRSPSTTGLFAVPELRVSGDLPAAHDPRITAGGARPPGTRWSIPWQNRRAPELMALAPGTVSGRTRSGPLSAPAPRLR